MGLSARKKILYALGQFGLVLCAYGVGKYFVTFFVNRGFSDIPVFPVYISQGYLFGFFTIIGLIIAFTRLVDAGAGLITGYISDRSRLRRGRRTGLMAIAVIPLVVFSALVFFPPTARVSGINAAVLFAGMVLFYIFLSLYTIPYLALMSEYGTSSRDRMKLSVIMACMTVFATILGDRLVWYMDFLHSVFGFSPLIAFRVVIVIFAIISGVCMMAPAFLLNEKRHTVAEPARDSFEAAFSAVFRDTCFRPYLIADIMYRIASALALAGFSYYVTILLGLPQTMTVFFMFFMFFASLALYFPVYYIVKRIGKRKMLFAAFLMLMAFLTASVFAGKYPIPAFAQGVVFSILIAIPVAVFTVVPNAIVADLAVAAEKKTGIQRGGMYFGVYSFVTKIGQMLSSLLFPALLSVGARERSEVSRTGLRVTLILAAVFALVGFLALFGYREKEVAALLEKKD